MSPAARLAAGTPLPSPRTSRDLVKPDDPEWFARELAIAVAPPWWFWRFMLEHFSWLVSIFGRVEVTGEIPEELRRGPLLFAANHIGDFDPFVIAVALYKVGVMPRIMATGGIISAPVAGAAAGAHRRASASSAAPSWPGTRSGSPRWPWCTAGTSSPIRRAGSG